MDWLAVFQGRSITNRFAWERIIRSVSPGIDWFRGHADVGACLVARREHSPALFDGPEAVGRHRRRQGCGSPLSETVICVPAWAPKCSAYQCKVGTSPKSSSLAG